jgi:hypothetical protein
MIEMNECIDVRCALCALCFCLISNVKGENDWVCGAHDFIVLCQSIDDWNEWMNWCALCAVRVVFLFNKQC